MMKKVFLLLFVGCIAFPAISQVEEKADKRVAERQRVYENKTYERKEVKTLFGPHSKNGGYGAISIGYTQIDGGNGIIMGGRGEWIIGHSLGLGIGGNAFVNDPKYVAADDLYYNLVGGYGGFIIEPILMGRWPVHLSFPIMIGAGGVALTSLGDDIYAALDNNDAYLEGASAFFVAEPSVELELNLVKWMRLSFFGSYRYTTDMHITDNQFSDDALTGWSAGITFKVGGF